MSDFSLINFDRSKVLGGCLFICLYIFSFCSLNAAGLSEFQVDRSSFEQSSLFMALGKVVRDFQGWDYDRTSQISISIPGINKEVVFNWGFVGSGDLFSSLGSVKAKWRDSSLGNEQGNFAVGLGKALIEDKLRQMGDDVPGLGWLLNADMSPQVLFCVKLLMLFKNIGQDGGPAKIQAELVRLLIRMAQVDDFKIFEKYKSFSDYLPSYVKEVIEKISPQALIFMNEVFSIIADSNRNWDSEKSLAVSGFVFSNDATAEEFKTKFGDKRNFCELVKQEIKQSDRGNLSVEDFFKLRDVPKIGENLIGVQDFGAIQQQNLASLSDAGRKAISTITDSTQFPKVVKITQAFDEVWLFYISDRLNATQTTKMILSALIQAFKEYKQARTGYFKSNGEEKKKFERLMTEQQKKIAQIERFLQTEAGQGSQARLNKELGEINICFASNSGDKSATDLLQAKKLQEEIEDLSQKVQTLENEISGKRALLGLGEHSDKLNQQIIAEKTKELEAVKKEIATKGQEKRSLALDKGQAIISDQKERVKKYKENLRKLEVVAKDKEFSGEEIDQNLLNTIATLRAKIEELEGRDDSSLTLEERLNKRRMTADVYLKEIDYLQKELDEQKKRFETISDPVDRDVERLMFNETEKPCRLQMQNLKEEAEKIFEENKQVEVLRRLREKMNNAGFSAQSSDELKKLENAVGYIIDSKKCTSPFVGYLEKNKEFKEFISCVNSDIPEYAQITNNLKDRLGQVVQISDHVQDHKKAYQYLIERCVPELQIPVDAF